MLLKDIGQLKLLAEFASQSENEGALEVIRVQSFILIGSGYSPLIYDFKPDIAYEEFIRRVEDVHKNFKLNLTLPEKIVNF
jgi:hypothetical protein